MIFKLENYCRSIFHSRSLYHSGKGSKKKDIKMGHVFLKDNIFSLKDELPQSLKAFCVDDNKANTKDMKPETGLVTKYLGKAY